MFTWYMYIRKSNKKIQHEWIILKKKQVLYGFEATSFLHSTRRTSAHYLSYHCADSNDHLNVIYEQVNVYFTGTNLCLKATMFRA